jgi:hypothetical protein
MDTQATSIFKDPTVDIAILTSITNKQPWLSIKNDELDLPSLYLIP